MTRLGRFPFLGSLFWAFLVGGLTGMITSAVFPTKKGMSLDIVLGMIGAFLGGVFLNFLRVGAPRFVGWLLFQGIGALVLILFGRLLSRGGK